jgi:alkaline phosphatase D
MYFCSLNLYFEIMYKKAILFLLFFSSLAFSQNSILQSGPMVGYCEMKEAVIWLQTTHKATVRIEYFALDNPKVLLVSENYSTSKEVGYTYHIVLDGLQPGKKYNYSVFIDTKKVILPYETTFSSKKLWQWREDAPDFSVAFGSCNYVNEPEVDRPGKGYGSGFEIFESIAKKNPDIMIWGGDNMYLREADWDSKSGIYYRSTHTRAIKEIQPLLAKTQNFAIWDDHDYGTNDSDRSFYNKYVTQKAFKDFWANKTYGIDASQNEGTFSTFNWGDAQFFLLDDRFFRSPNDRITGDQTMLGKAQLEWLIDALSASIASFKIIVIGGQVINDTPVSENYGHYPEEKAKLFSEILDNKIKGVLFLTGDRHFAELSKLNRADTYPIYDWTVSPFTSGVVIGKSKETLNPNREEGSAFFTHNFGIVSFSGNKENRQIKLSLFDTNGVALWEKVILKKELE